VTVTRGIVESCVINRGEDARGAIARTVELCCVAESLGLDRFWITEHHCDNIATASPELLIPLLGASSNTISVGVGGLLLSLYSPLQVANQLNTLEALFPGRISFGIGRGKPPLERRAAYGDLLIRDSAAYSKRVHDLVAYIHDPQCIAPYPVVGTKPRLWLCGSGTESSSLATALGIPYSHALFLDRSLLTPTRSHAGALAVINCRNNGLPVDITIAGSCAGKFTGRLGESQEFGLAITINVAGAYSECRRQVAAVVDTYAPTSLSLLDLSPTFELKMESYRLFADICNDILGKT